MKEERKIKLTKLDLINIAFLVIFVSIYEYLIVFYNMGNEISNWRYYLFAVVTCFSFIMYFLQRRKKYNRKEKYGRELLYLIITAIIFLIVSIQKCKIQSVSLPFRVWVQISLFLLPALYAYALTNIFNMEKIFILMKLVTIITIIMYFLEPAHNLFMFFDIRNWLNINLIHSISFTESHNFSDTFLQLFLFFNYYKEKVTDERERKKLKPFSNITLLFTILAFKRFSVLFVFCMIIMKKFIHYDKKIKIPTTIVAMFFVIITILYTKLLQGKLISIEYNKLFDFTSGRNWILYLWAEKNYVSYGYGSSMLVINRFLEMDLTQIYLELNVACLFIYCYTFFKIPKKNLYANLVMIYVFFNMLTSSSLPWSIGWIVMFINVASIATNKYEKERNLNDGQNFINKSSDNTEAVYKR